MSDKPENQDVEETETDAKTAPESVASIAEDLIENMPEVQEHAIATHIEREKAAPLTDKSGNIFEPLIHATGPDGKPAFTASGNFAKKRGRKAGQSTVGSLGDAPKTGNQKDAPPGRVIMDHATLGQVAAGMTVQVAMVLGGPDMAPGKNVLTGESDELVLTRAYRDYFIATNRNDLPPALALAFAVGSYAVPKMNKPSVKDRLVFVGKSVMSGVKKLWEKWKGRKSGK